MEPGGDIMNHENLGFAGQPIRRHLKMFLELHALLHLCVELEVSDELSGKVDLVVDFFREDLHAN